MADVEIGIGKTGRRAYGFDDIAIVPSRRTRDPEDVSLAWEIDAYRFDLPLVASAMDGVVSPTTAIEIGRLGGLAVLNLEGLWTRYDDPEPLLDEIASLPAEQATARMQEIYAKPIEADLITARVKQVRDSGVTVAASLTPQRTVQFAQTVLDSGVDLFVIQGTVVSAEHVSSRSEPLNLKRFISDLDVPVLVGGCATYQSALHLMRTGAAGILVGVGPGQANTTRGVLGLGVPMATSIADAAGARRDYLDESGGRYVHVIADGGMRTGGDVAKAIACGADAVMMGAPLARALEAPGRGRHWSMETTHGELPRGTRVRTSPVGTLKEVLVGPAAVDDGSMNIMGSLRASMAATGYSTLKEFQKVDVMVAPSITTEGKGLQRAQGVGPLG
ncbi:MAG: GuaB3 family IMP dehydrogenase-related protein [Actinomycetota bacterium]|nr:GuaB3 family IMP dehydrogenase-related protein [Actinomycetota bacterium]